MEYAIKTNGHYESRVFNTKTIQTHSKSAPITLMTSLPTGDFTYYKSLPVKDTLTYIDLPKIVNMKLVSSSPFSYITGTTEPKYYSKKEIETYLYEMDYGNIDYDLAYRYLNEGDLSGGCSAIRKGNLVGRNFDWVYDNSVGVVVHTPASFDRYAVMGVAESIPYVDKDTIKQSTIVRDGVDMFSLIPFYLVDGVNSTGLYCCHNVVPIDSTSTKFVFAKKEEKERVSVMMLVRFILDRFKAIKEAIDYIRDYVTIVFPDEMLNKKLQSHFMLGDGGKNKILEFKDGEMIVVDGKWMTNFRVNDVKFEKITYPAMEHGVEKYGMGLERWDKICEGYSEIKDKEGMWGMMNEIRYENGYGEPFWKSDICGMDDDDSEKINVDTDIDKCSNAIWIVRDAYDKRDRNTGVIWITIHSSVYDLEKKEMELKDGESVNVYRFMMK